MARRGILVIISSPSGAGKTTLARRLLSEHPTVEFSVSYTTRKPRHNEIDGKDYVFVSDDELDRMIEAGELAEWAVVHGNRYGTSRAAVERALVAGRDVVFDVDGQGGRALSGQFPDDALMIFILPPSLDVLAERLRRRATDAPDVIDRRLRKAIEELQYHRDYQFRIVNAQLERAYLELRAIYLVRRGVGELGPERAVLAQRDDAALREHAEKLIRRGQDPPGV